MEFSQLAVPSVYLLLLFLGYPTQWLLLHLDPGPLTRNELIASNIIVILIFITYTQSVFVNPGAIPKDWAEKELATEKESKTKTRKWCSKCQAPKPPRAHHCKTCGSCIPKMDHHCPWTANCVSHTTFPHFLRLLVYTTLGSGMLQIFLFVRLYALWQNRDLPAYLGPSMFLLGLLFATFFVNSITLFAVGILCVRNIWCLAVNTTTIEGWEIERHRTLVRRARTFGGYLETPDGSQVRIKKQEFPYDIGIWANIVQGMGSANPLMWFNPFAKSPSVESGVQFEINGFEDKDAVWPPPDPDRAYKRPMKAVNGGAFTYQNSDLSAEETMAAFRARQAEDVVRRRQPFVERLEALQSTNARDDDDGDLYEYGDDASDAEDEKQERGKYGDGEGEEGWRNSEGERLKDFGVDEDVEFYDEQEDEIPLAELISRRREASASTSAY
jgi:palmitoyltransferase